MASLNRTQFQRLFGLARPEARNLFFATIALVIASGLSLTYPLLLQRLVDALSSDAGPEVMKQTGALLLVLPLLSGIAGRWVAVTSRKAPPPVPR